MSGPRPDLPEPVLGRFWPESERALTRSRSQIALAFGQGSLRPDFGRFAELSGQSRFRKPGPGTGSSIEQHKVINTLPIYRLDYILVASMYNRLTYRAATSSSMGGGQRGYSTCVCEALARETQCKHRD